MAGTAGTAALTLAYMAERRLRPSHRGPLDYDDSLVPGQIVASIMHLPPRHRPGGPRRLPDPALELRISVRSLARHAPPEGSRALGERDLRWDADERDAVAVPAARANAAAVALASRRDSHLPGYSPRLRGRGGHRRRSRAPAGSLTRAATRSQAAGQAPRPADQPDGVKTPPVVPDPIARVTASATDVRAEGSSPAEPTAEQAAEMMRSKQWVGIIPDAVDFRSADAAPECARAPRGRCKTPRASRPVVVWVLRASGMLLTHVAVGVT